MDNYLTVFTPDGPMEVYAAAEEHTHPLPVVVVLQEAFGVNAHIKKICRNFSGQGFFAVAPELYHRFGRHVQFPYTDRAVILPYLQQLSNEEILNDLNSLLAFLQDLPGVDSSKVYTVGFCVGGFSAILAATTLPLRGAISFYGAGLLYPREGFALKPLASELSNIECPLLLFFGEADSSIPQREVRELQELLKDHQVDHEIIVYPGSDHGFFCDERRSYDSVAASFAWKKIFHWLDSRPRKFEAESSSLSEDTLN